LDNHP
jgi:hypothetical protein